MFKTGCVDRCDSENDAFNHNFCQYHNLIEFFSNTEQRFGIIHIILRYIQVDRKTNFFTNLSNPYSYSCISFWQFQLNLILRMSFCCKITCKSTWFSFPYITFSLNTLTRVLDVQDITRKIRNLKIFLCLWLSRL